MHFNELPLAKHKISRPLKNCPLSIPISGTTFGLENTKKKLLIVDSIVVLKTSKSHVTPIKKCTNVFFGIIVAASVSAVFLFTETANSKIALPEYQHALGCSSGWCYY